MNSRTSKNILSEKLYNRAIKVLAGGLSRNTIYRDPHPLYASDAKGAYITDVDGTKRIDFANNMSSLIHGHSHPEIINAVVKQIYKGTAYTMGSEIEINYAELLNNRTNGFEKIRFVNSGTEAVMTMIKASRAYTGRTKIAKAEGTYHGTYDYAEISQSSNPTNWGDVNNPSPTQVVDSTPKSVLKDVIIFPFNDIKRTLDILDKHSAEIACVLIDLIPHRVGLVPAFKEYIDAIYHWTRKNQVVLAFDEVVSYRAYYSGAQEIYNITPDLTAMGKIIGGGFPIGAIAGKSEIMKVLDPREKSLKHPHSGTFSANPISTTAGYVAMKIFDKDAVNDLNNLTFLAKKQINEAITLADIPACITGMGSMFRIHFQDQPPRNFRESYQDANTKKIIKELLDYLFIEEKILLMNTCTCMLSTALIKSDIDHLTQALLNGFNKIKPLLKNAK
ncbi:MAG: aspartate aminotransferase family protein [Flavobacteriales bacterium]|nr:aspartate aminotransferase family protein [Flavobacteriales bacterium]|tara:strand:+ start:18 stop:1358 length:1341 start_codon:yes stop_codon:yes gene_type:complete